MKTNNLDLNAYAVEELNEVETLQMEGGSLPTECARYLAKENGWTIEYAEFICSLSDMFACTDKKG